jgi:kumamolisin
MQRPDARFSICSRVTPVLLVALAGACNSDDSPGIDTATTSSSSSGGSSSSGFVPTTAVDPTTGSVDPSTTTGSVDPSTTSTGPVDPTTGPVLTTDISTSTSTTADDTTTSSTSEAESSTGECPPEEPLCQIPPEEMVPEDKPDGLPSPLPGVYDDQGEAPLDNQVRALIGFPTRERAALETKVKAMYDPQNPAYGEYMTVDEWMTGHAPPVADFELIKDWLESRNFQVNFEAKNRTLIQFSGSVADFNETFDTTLHICMRKNPQAGNPPFPVYCTLTSFTLPLFVANRTTGLLTADLPAATGVLPGEAGVVQADPPGDGAFDPNQIAVAYEVDDLFNLGFTGQGQTIGVIAAAHYHQKDLQIFWLSFGIDRALPTKIELMEPVVTRITETILDTQWSTSMAPGADVIVYEGPDARNTSLMYVFNEAIARNEAGVLTDSFAHREDSEPKPLRDQYDHSALMAAALGITVLSASGDSGQVDVPCSSPFVTCVGGTELVTDNVGNVISETAWSSSGSGENKSFALPYWQQGIPAAKRAVVEVALNADPSSGMWVRRFGEWQVYGGTSFSSPIFAGVVAVMNSYLESMGQPRMGFMNPQLYLNAGVRASFRDVVLGGTPMYDAGVGWDYPTGWGAPRAKKLADAWP